MKTYFKNVLSVFCLLVSASLLIASPSFAGTPENYLMWQMPASGVSFPIYVYSNGAQVGYLYGTTQQAFAGAYDPQSTTASYQLYYQNGGVWYSCSIALANGSLNSSATTCPGAVINSPVNTSNVYTIALGATAWPSAATSPVNPVNTDYGKRRITFINDTKYSMIQIGEHCTVSVNPNNPNCVNKENLFQIQKGKSKILTIDNAKKEGANFPAGLNSAAFTVTAYKNKAGKIVKTGGYGAGENPYATKIESTSLPVNTSNGIQTPTGATNFDVSAVDGYNFNVIAYPESPTYCTYTVPPENSNVLGAGLYSKDKPLAQLTGLLASLCKNSSQLPTTTGADAWNLTVSNGGEFQGCMSPCTYATKNSGVGSPTANQFCCAGSFGGSPEACDQPAGTLGANNSTYVTNLQPPVSTHVYRFAYDDAIGDFACPAETNFVIKFVSVEAA